MAIPHMGNKTEKSESVHDLFSFPSFNLIWGVCVYVCVCVCVCVYVCVFGERDALNLSDCSYFSLEVTHGENL